MPNQDAIAQISKAHMFIDSYRNTGHINMLMQAIDILIGIAGDAERKAKGVE